MEYTNEQLMAMVQGLVKQNEELRAQAAVKVTAKSERDYMATAEKLLDLGVEKVEKVVLNATTNEEVKSNGKKAIKSILGAAAISYFQNTVGLGAIGDTVANVTKAVMVGNAIHKGAKAVEIAFDTDHISAEDLEEFYN